MGNNSTKSLKDRNKLTKSLNRLINYVYDDPDVETLKIPFNVARDIFLHLSLADLHSCMLVCKEWRSLVDTCSFLDEFLLTNFDFSKVASKKGSVLRSWRGLFKPFPNTWGCGIVVPRGMGPACGSLDVYHSFIQALIWIGQLQRHLVSLHHLEGATRLEICLLPWHNDHMPSSDEVVNLLGGRPSLISGLAEAKPLTKQEMRHYLTIMNGKYTKSKYDADLYRFIADKVWDRVILFECNKVADVLPPSFIITRLSPGWVGGIIYTC